MKRGKYYRGIILFLSLVVLNSCAYYEVFETKSKDVMYKQNKYIYSDEDIILQYFFWSIGGVMNFNIYNNSNKPIYIDLNKSHFIFNEASFDYYKAESISKVNQVTRSYNYQGYIKSATITGKTITNQQKRIIEIQPKTYVNIGDYQINSTIIKDCSFKRFPKRNNPVATSYETELSPFVFKNILTYAYDDNFTNPTIITNLFWISDIFFIIKRDLLGKSGYLVECHKKTNKMVYEEPYKQSNRFWLKWNNPTIYK
jgi:hypothetical protein